MSDLQYPGTELMFNAAQNDIATRGTSSDALSSYRRGDRDAWTHAIDEMLRWKAAPDQFDASDQPNDAILETAIDYAVDQRDENGPAPDSIVLSGSGRIAMEWNDDSATVVVEFVGLGAATYSRFMGQQLQEGGRLTRNPRSRKLELQC
jgi:hypothetical protein